MACRRGPKQVFRNVILGRDGIQHQGLLADAANRWLAVLPYGVRVKLTASLSVAGIEDKLKFFVQSVQGDTTKVHAAVRRAIEEEAQEWRHTFHRGERTSVGPGARHLLSL